MFKLNCSVNGENRSPVPVILSRVVSHIFSLLQQGIFCALLVLVYKQALTCRDTMLTVVLITSTVLFSLKLFFLFIEIFEPLLPACFHRKQKEEVTVDEESCNIPNNYKNETASNLADWNSIGTDFDKLDGVLRWRARFAAVLSPLICLGILGLIVSGVFFLATTIKLAIPSDYTTKCSSSFESKFIMLGTLAAAVIINSVYLVVMLPQRIFVPQLKCVGVIYFIVLVFASVFCFSTSIWLFVRLARVWRGLEPELYEYIALGLVLPLLSSWRPWDFVTRIWLRKMVGQWYACLGKTNNTGPTEPIGFCYTALYTNRSAVNKWGLVKRTHASISQSPNSSEWTSEYVLSNHIPERY